MTGKERREQLLGIGRRLFAERGFEGTSIEEIAAQAGVSKPVVYEHFGGKEGLYAVVVDREVERLLAMVTGLLDGGHTRAKFEAAAVALLRYINDNADGFRILVRDSNPGSGTGTYGTLLSDIAGQVEYILADFLASRGHDPKLAPLYAQMLVGMVAFTGQWWLDARKPKLEEVAANLIDLAGLRFKDIAGIRPCLQSFCFADCQVQVAVGLFKKPVCSPDGGTSSGCAGDLLSVGFFTQALRDRTLATSAGSKGGQASRGGGRTRKPKMATLAGSAVSTGPPAAFQAPKPPLICATGRSPIR
jgi:AcrR family transcriptional regulator